MSYLTLLDLVPLDASRTYREQREDGAPLMYARNDLVVQATERMPFETISRRFPDAASLAWLCLGGKIWLKTLPDETLRLMDASEHPPENCYALVAREPVKIELGPYPRDVANN